MDSTVKRSLFWGIVAGAFLLSIYFAILTLANSFNHAIEQFQLLWYWIIALALGFSTQVALYTFIRRRSREINTKNATREVVAAGGISTGSMIACCAHHLVDFLPLLGLSAAFLFLAQYQLLFIVLGIASNVIGITIMLQIIKKHSLYEKKGVLAKIMRLNFKIVRNISIAGSIVVLIVVFAFLFYTNSGRTSNEKAKDNANQELNKNVELPVKSNEGGGLSIEAKPINYKLGEQLLFEVTLNTHVGDLNFDLAGKTLLFDNLNNQYTPLEWSGEQGGHHLIGTLKFPPVSKNVKTLKLVISDVYDVRERVFQWDIK